ncbi:MAG: SUMF1/EgtB/PvdO family nonheme iron enzyme, partial [Candidatus Cloacimonetes bacterium]|nr:SUMF1/EgtB/PvdO family nonheme iron enzyme [Candidatus Cloacimonadota bacterium]
NLIDDFYFKAPSSSQPQERKAAQPAIQVESTILTGTLEVESNTAGDLYLDGNYVCSIAKSEIKTLRNVPAGSHELELRYDGKSQKQSVSVLRDQSSKYAFNISKVVSAPAIMVYVEGGTFQMGSNSASNEKPVHQVTLSSYYIGKYEVTQKEWQEVMGSNPSYWKGDNLPVEKVSWYDVLVYCNKRSLKEGLTPCYSISGNSEPSRWDSVPSARNSTWDAVTCNWSANGYRLPTEAEWEYAARGGNKSKGYRYSGSNDIKSVAWYWENSGKKTHSVGGKQANELGIYDMSGNVLEWCWDGYNESYYSKSESRDPRGSGSGKSRVQRGSSWSGNDYSCRVAYRASGRDPENGFSYDGFRVLRAIK